MSDVAPSKPINGPCLFILLSKGQFTTVKSRALRCGATLTFDSLFILMRYKLHWNMKKVVKLLLFQDTLQQTAWYCALHLLTVSGGPLKIHRHLHADCKARKFTVVWETYTECTFFALCFGVNWP